MMIFNQTGHRLISCLLCMVLTGCATDGTSEKLQKAALVNSDNIDDMNCKPIGVMYGRGANRDKAINELLINTRKSGGSHVTIQQIRETNKRRFDMDKLFVDINNHLILGDGYMCSGSSGG